MHQNLYEMTLIFLQEMAQGNVSVNETEWPAPSEVGYCTGCKMNGTVYTCDCPLWLASSCDGYDGCSGNKIGTLCPPGVSGSNDKWGYRCGTDGSPPTKQWLENSGKSDWDSVLGDYGKSVSLDTSTCPQFPLWKKMGLEFPGVGIKYNVQSIMLFSRDVLGTQNVL